MSDITALTSATTQFNRYTPMPVFVLGLIGNIFNIFIFTRRSLFSNPCSIYLLSATCTNIVVLFVGLVIRSLMDGFNIDIIGDSIILCRLRYIILHPSYALSSLATVRNIRFARVRVTVTAGTNGGQLNKKDRQLILMLLIQLIATIICTLPHAIQKFYSTFTVNDIKTPYRLAIESLMPQITRQLLYINASMIFYL